MSGPRDTLLAHLASVQEHVLAAVEGLDAKQLEREVAPSGWSIARLLGHLVHDDEVFWVHAILGGDQAAVDSVQDGWAAGMTGPEAVCAYREAAERSQAVLAAVDLDAPPAWWPDADIFPFPAYATGWQVAFHLLSELATHAGQLDVVREQIDGHQHLVVG